jgi:uncharacterized membrane protein
VHHAGTGGSIPAIYSGMGQCTILALVAVPLPSIQVWDSAPYWHWWQCPCHPFRYGKVQHTGIGGSAPATYSGMGQCTILALVAMPMPSIQIWLSAILALIAMPCHLFNYGTVHHTGTGGSALVIYSGLGQCTILALVAVPLPSIQVWQSAILALIAVPCHLFRYGTVHHTGTGGSAPVISLGMGQCTILAPTIY